MSVYVFEGPDEVGKSTITKGVARALRGAGISSIDLAFPGNDQGTLGHLIYELHHNPESFRITDLSPTSLQVMHVAAHIDAIERNINPALEEGMLVVLDRYWWSTWVYGKLTGISETILSAMIALEELHWSLPIPPTIFLVSRNQFSEASPQPEHNRLAALYEELASREETRGAGRVIRLSNNGTPEDAINLAVEQILESRL